MKPKPGLFSSWKVASEQGGGPRAQGKHHRMGRVGPLPGAHKCFSLTCRGPSSIPYHTHYLGLVTSCKPICEWGDDSCPRGAVRPNSAKG